MELFKMVAPPANAPAASQPSTAAKTTAPSMPGPDKGRRHITSGEREKARGPLPVPNRRERDDDERKLSSKARRWLPKQVKVSPVAKAATAAAGAVHSKAGPAAGKLKSWYSREIKSVRAIVPPDILILTPSAAERKAIVDSGFTLVGPADGDASGLSLSRIIAPPGMSQADAAKARRQLRSRLHEQRFGTNRVYRPYHAQSDRLQAANSGAVGVRAASAVPCSQNRCYGAKAVGWKAPVTTCARGMKVGVIDTAVDRTHPALRGRAIRTRSFITPGSEPAPMWHGTGVLTILAGDPDGGTPGLIPNSSFYVADVFFRDDSGLPATDTSRLIAALKWMDEQDVRVINLSVSGPADVVMQEAVKRLAKKNTVFIAAAGNGGPAAKPSYPAAYGQVIAVTAIDRDLRSYRYANRGSYIDLAAPGVAIWTAVPDRQEGFVSGTSFAAPYVTAMVAAIYRNVKQPAKASILNELDTVDLGQPLTDPIYGRGLVRAPVSCGKARVASDGKQPGFAESSAALSNWTSAVTRASTFAPSGLFWEND
ncbi:MAG: S8 family serine peptidase [Hyphomicrobiaceae bacterium]